jgi:hypothetical protein
MPQAYKVRPLPGAVLNYYTSSAELYYNVEQWHQHTSLLLLEVRLPIAPATSPGC